MKSLKINYPLKDVTFEEKSEDFRPHADLPEYPYGLRLCLNSDTIKMLGLSKLPELGSSMKMNAIVKVVAKNEFSNDEDEVNLQMDLQITDMELTSSKKEIDPSKLYDAVNVTQEVK